MNCWKVFSSIYVSHSSREKSATGTYEMSNVSLPSKKLFVAKRTAVVVIRSEIFLVNFEEVVALADLE